MFQKKYKRRLEKRTPVKISELEKMYISPERNKQHSAIKVKKASYQISTVDYLIYNFYVGEFSSPEQAQLMLEKVVKLCSD